MGAVSRRLDDGRLHLQHGPIDLIVELFGAEVEVQAGYVQAERCFAPILAGLVGELALLRRPLGEPYPLPRDPIARAMVAAAWPHRAVFVTPMAAVAGAVADAVMAAAWRGRELRRGYVNNGGDIAFALMPGEGIEGGIVERVDKPALDARVRIEAEQPVRGLATSGWRGRSQSLGIADAVTVLASSAAAADVAATLIANAVTADHPAIRREPANTLDPDSDLGDRSVTVAVGELPAPVVRAALAAGLEQSRAMRAAGLIEAAYLSLAGNVATEGPAVQAGPSQKLGSRHGR